MIPFKHGSADEGNRREKMRTKQGVPKKIRLFPGRERAETKEKEKKGRKAGEGRRIEKEGRQIERKEDRQIKRTGKGRTT